VSTIIDQFTEASDSHHTISAVHPSTYSRTGSLRGVSFTGNGYNVTEARFYVQRMGSSSTAQFKAYIYAKPSSGYVPLGTLLAASEPVNFNDMPTTDGWVSFNFTGSNIFTTVSGQTYLICIVCTAAGLSNTETGSPLLRVLIKNVVYPNRRSVSYFNLAWEDSNAWFYLFQVLGIGSGGGGGGTDLNVLGNLNVVGTTTLNNKTTLNKELIMSGDVPHRTKEQIVDAIWGFNGNDWAPQELPHSPSRIVFYDTKASATNEDMKVNVMAIVSDEGGSWVAPLLAVDTGMVVQKDISCGGYVAANQGELWLGHGRKDKLDPPKIILAHADSATYGQAYDTLYLKKANNNGVNDPAHLDLQDLTAHGDINIGNRGCFADVGKNNIIGVQGKTDRSLGGFRFGNGSGRYYHELFVENNYLMYYCNGGNNPCGFMPYDGNQNLGGPSPTSHPYPWRHIYGRWIHAYDQFMCNNKAIGNFDSLDDLGIIKSIKSIRVKSEADGVERDVVDFSNLEFLQTDKENISVNNTIGFLLGVCKFLALKVDELEAKIEKKSADKK